MGSHRDSLGAFAQNYPGASNVKVHTEAQWKFGSYAGQTFAGTFAGTGNFTSGQYTITYKGTYT